MLVRHIGLSVLSVVDEHINATAESHPLIVGRVDFPGWFQFIVGYVGDAHTIFLDPVIDSSPLILGDCIEDRKQFIFQCENEDEADELTKLTWTLVFQFNDRWIVYLDGLIIKAEPPKQIVEACD